MSGVGDPAYPAGQQFRLTPGRQLEAPDVRIQSAGPAFTDAVLRDLRRLTRIAAGRGLLLALREYGVTVLIRRPDPPLDPPNAWIMPPRAQAGGEVTVVYDPADWPSIAHPGSKPGDAVLLGLLQGALEPPS
jgi:hypothetical protein